MSFYSGYVDNSGGVLAHYEMLRVIKEKCELEGWTTLRYDTVPANRELIMRAPGLSGTIDYYCGIRTYQDAGADYYNLCAAGFTGYIAGNTFDTQPGAVLSGVPAHNQRIDYWLAVNGQRLVLVMKVGTPVYETMYLGRFNTYAMPSTWPYPVVCAGMLNGAAATRFSDTNHSMPFKGGRVNMRVRNQAGAWVQPECWPWYGQTAVTGNTTITTASLGGFAVRPTDAVAPAQYSLDPVIMMQSGAGIFVELDGVYKITGFDNAVENEITIGGVSYIVIQDVWRTGFGDYFALRKD